MKTRRSRWKVVPGSEAFRSSLLIAVFFILGVIGLLHHPMWRDETNSWLMARFSGSLHELCLVTQYENHFILWQLLLWILTRFTHDCQALQWFHLALATCGVWLVVRFGPFTRTQKVLYCFSYFAFFEYCLVCREYVCIVLLMFSLCALCDWRKDSFVLQALAVFLLANINVYATSIAFTFVAASALEHFRRRDVNQLWATRKRPLIVTGLILCAALLAIGLQLIKPPDATTSQALRNWRHSLPAWDPATAVCNIWRGYVPIPMPFPQLRNLAWGSNFLLDHEQKNLAMGVMLSLGLLAVSTWTLRRSPMAVAWYLSGTCLMLLFQSIVTVGALRHSGLYFILYLSCLWSRSTWAPPQSLRTAPASPSAQLERFFLPVILALQVVAGVYVWLIHYSAPFSNSKRAADFIRQHGYANLLIAGSREAFASPLTAYLDRPIYYPDTARYGTFIYDTTTPHDLSTPQALARVAQLATTVQGDVLFVLNDEITLMKNRVAERLTSAWLHPDGSVSRLSETPVKPGMQISLLVQFRGAIVGENYSLYLIQHR